MNGIPTISLNYDLADVATSITNWFSSFWLIVAFAVAIPLAFLIANRLKSLFVA
ncbi:hypothetical protein [Shouchella clausii]|uniref:hypothetical protein n=1 Tax=Shouchella clausii TaxID=79880 RepID=UPI0015C7AF05|nr:hypothetical protein [Shouchella clausii]